MNPCGIDLGRLIVTSDRLKQYLLDRYPGTSRERTAVREDTEIICRAFSGSGLADRDFLEQLCSGQDSAFWQRYSEARLADELFRNGHRPRSAAAGPDYLIESDGRRIWVEVICPSPNGIPTEWLEPRIGEAVSMPIDPITLRWTSAIKEKTEKLIGSEARGFAGYHQLGIVGPKDAYVIAINGRMLRGCSPQLNGISQVPFAAEVAFAIGPYHLRLNRQTLEVVGSGHGHRPIVFNRNRAPVPSYAFLDEANAGVSAIWAVDLDECRSVGNSQPMAVIHNPMASNPLPQNFLPSHEEFVATLEGELGTLERRAGRHP